jgi:hypothetical protein
MQIEEHLISSKIEPFQFPHARAEPKMKMSTNNVQDPVTLLAQKFDQMNAQVCPEPESDHEQVDEFRKETFFSKASVSPENRKTWVGT